VHNLVSDLPNIADHQDKNLVNPWGNGFGPTPFWIGNNGTGTSTLYDGTGAALPLTVTIPQAQGAGNAGPVTGVIFNTFSSNAAAFNVAGKPASFLFCAEDGVISGWNSGTAAAIVFDNSKSGAVYKGCALAGTSSAPVLLAANFNAGTVDVFDAKFNLNPSVYAKAFVDSAIPAGFAPFNVQVMQGMVFVTYAKQDSAKHDDVGGPGNGYVAIFDQSGNLVSTLISQGPLNSPWGLAIAPANFGPFAGDLLVGNFGDGKINAFTLSNGTQAGTLNDATGKPIAMPGLWSINFGSGARNEDPLTLYFTAGIGGGPNNDPLESHGLLGSIQPAPLFTTANVSSAAVGVAGQITASDYGSIKGNALAPMSATWTVTGNTLPTSLNGVGVTINGEAANVTAITNQQINFITPSDLQPGNAQIVVTNNGLTSQTVTATVTTLAPALFALGNATNGHTYIIAGHTNGTYVAPANFISATVASSPAAPGETIILYGTGFGANLSGTNTLPVMPTIVIDGYAAHVQFAGQVSPGIDQFNVVVPTTVSTGQDVLVVALLGNTETQANAYIPIQPVPAP